MNLINFINRFPDENSCKLRFKEIRDQEGVIVGTVAAKTITGTTSGTVVYSQYGSDQPPGLREAMGCGFL